MSRSDAVPSSMGAACEEAPNGRHSFKVPKMTTFGGVVLGEPECRHCLKTPKELALEGAGDE